MGLTISIAEMKMLLNSVDEKEIETLKAIIVERQEAENDSES